MMKETKVVEPCRYHGAYCISWTAIFAGTLVSLGLGLLLNLFGLSIDLVAFKPNPEGHLALAIGGYIGMLIGTIAIMFTSGWVTGHLASRPDINECLGALYGFITWCLALIIAIFIASHAFAFFTMHYHAMYMSGSDLMVLSQNAGSATAQTDHAMAIPAKTPAIAVFLTFVLFFVAAIASAFGGHCGIKSRRTEAPTM